MLCDFFAGKHSTKCGAQNDAQVADAAVSSRNERQNQPKNRVQLNQPYDQLYVLMARNLFLSDH